MRRISVDDAMSNPTKVQTRGRVTLPAQLRLALDLQPGDEVDFVEVTPGHFEVKAASDKPALLRKSREPTSRTSIRVRGPDETPESQLKLPL